MQKIETGISELLKRQPVTEQEKDAYIRDLQKFYEVCCKSGLIFCGKLHLTKRTVPSSYLLWAGQWKVLRSATGIPASSDFASRHSCGAIENLRHFPFAYTAEQSHPPPTAGP